MVENARGHSGPGDALVLSQFILSPMSSSSLSLSPLHPPLLPPTPVLCPSSSPLLPCHHSWFPSIFLYLPIHIPNHPKKFVWLFLTRVLHEFLCVQSPMGFYGMTYKEGVGREQTRGQKTELPAFRWFRSSCLGERG